MLRPFVLCTLIPLLLSSCANLNSIDRTTYLENGAAKTVHLDAQQRLLIVNNMGRYCAEPSPDALASYAAAVGAGVSAPNAGAASISGGGQSNAASIGLRTQSITLMRDALYRMCEAYGNGAIGKAQVVTLLNRSQDLTAVILAVEQLTGAVAANQVALTGSSGANSNATTLNNSKLFAQATDHEVRLLATLNEAKAAKLEAERKYDDAEALVSKAETALEAAKAGGDESKILAAESEVSFRVNRRATINATLSNASSRVDSYQSAYDKAQSVTAEIAKSPNSSLASSDSNTSGASAYSTPASRIALSKEATESVSNAVAQMVTGVLKKDYVVDSCMSVITSNHTDTPTKLERDTREFCQRLVIAMVRERAIIAEKSLQDVKQTMIQKNVDGITKILQCIAPNGQLDIAKRDQLFDDANTNGNLQKIFVTTRNDVSGMRTMLTQNTGIRKAMAAKTDSSNACK